MPTRDVWRIHQAGSLSRLKRETEELESPPPGHARVAVGAVGLNFADLAACLGLYSATPKGAFVPGLEFAGTVEAVGDGVSTVGPGRPGHRAHALRRLRHADQRRRAIPPSPSAGVELCGWRRAAGAGDHGVVRHQRTGRVQTRQRRPRAVGCRRRRPECARHPPGDGRARGGHGRPGSQGGVSHRTRRPRAAADHRARPPRVLPRNSTTRCAPTAWTGSTSCSTPWPGRSSSRRTGGCCRRDGW